MLNYIGGPEIQLDDDFEHNKINDVLADNSKIKENIGINEGNKEEIIEKGLIRSNNELNEKLKKYRKDMDNKEEINILSKIYNWKLTDIKPPKQKEVEDKIGPEIKKKLFTNLLSNINI